jgi:hypothetical protein
MVKKPKRTAFRFPPVWSNNVPAEKLRMKNIHAWLSLIFCAGRGLREVRFILISYSISWIWFSTDEETARRNIPRLVKIIPEEM